MQHNPILKDRVRKLRIKGFSLGEIYNQTGIPKTTIRSWIKDISLSKRQLGKLRDKTQKALQNGRRKMQKRNKDLKLQNEKMLLQKGVSKVGNLNNRDLFLSGIALYWGEGFKNIHEHRLGFCNSDPEMIKFYIKWLEKCFGITKNNLIARLTINDSYKTHVEKIEYYWLNITGIPKDQFKKTFYQKTQWKKQFNNTNYHGVLRIHVENSLNLLLLVRGFIEGMKLNVLK